MKHWKPVFAFVICITAVCMIILQFNNAPTVIGQQPPQEMEHYSHRFPDFNQYYAPPSDQYAGSLFRLSQDYPIETPSWDRRLTQIMEMPYGRENEAWKKYLIAVRDYCFEGNIEVQWQGQDNPIRKWYHVPWQHWGASGREGIHGLTREATAAVYQLGPNQSQKYQTYAVGLYNAIGGATIGHVWRDQNQPNPTVAKFAPGTVVCKILFTQTPSSDLPYLANPISWKAYADKSATDPIRNPADAPDKRSVQDVNLIQMDVMIRDERANDSGGWIFGNFCYNGELNNENPWHNLVPVGIMWGDDPDVTSDPRVSSNADYPPFPPKTALNTDLKQTIINPSDELPPQHLGFGSRLNGPVDYYNSSCMSCHSTAQYPAVAPLSPAFEKSLSSKPEYQPGQPGWMRWFRNVHCGEPFSPGQAFSMDFSLQLAASVQNFVDWKTESQQGYFTPYVPDARQNVPLAAASDAAPRAFNAPIAADVSQPERVEVFKIRRGPTD